MSRTESLQSAGPASKLAKDLSMLRDRVNELCLDQAAGTNTRIGITISEAAAMLGMSRAQFRRVFLTHPKRLQTVPVGDRARVIDVQELRVAFDRYKEESRATRGEGANRGA